MEYTTLGETGVQVSRICLGCFGFGDAQEWMLDERDSRVLIDRAIDHGINFFDTANVYSSGKSERILGNALEEYDRDRFVVATKVYHEMDSKNPNSSGLSRKAIEQELTASCERLGVDTIDLYQIHRWDRTTPIETTLRTLADCVRRGRIRHFGASAMWAYQFAIALRESDRLGIERFASMQNHYNLVYREEEREMLPLCDRENVGIMPFSPLGRGYLARPHESIDATARGTTDSTIDERKALYETPTSREINERVEKLADDHGVTMAQIALAWLLHKEWVDAPVVGVTSTQHLDEAVQALEIELSMSELEYLEAPYEPVPVVGHS